MKKGNEVLAGMINKEGIIEVRVTKSFEDSSISKLIKLIETSEKRKAKYNICDGCKGNIPPPWLCGYCDDVGGSVCGYGSCPYCLIQCEEDFKFKII